MQRVLKRAESRRVTGRAYSVSLARSTGAGGSPRLYAVAHRPSCVKSVPAQPAPVAGSSTRGPDGCFWPESCCAWRLRRCAHWAAGRPAPPILPARWHWSLPGPGCSYLIEGRVRTLVEEGRFLAQATAFELDGARTVTEADDILTRRRSVQSVRHTHVSFAVVPVHRSCGPGRTERPVVLPAMRKGPWAHMPSPGVPPWVTCAGAAGLVAFRTSAPAVSGPPVPVEVLVRAVAFPDEAEPGFAVVVDIPVTAALMRQLQRETGITIGAILPITTPGALQPSLNGTRVEDADVPEVREGLQGGSAIGSTGREGER